MKTLSLGVLFALAFCQTVFAQSTDWIQTVQATEQGGAQLNPEGAAVGPDGRIYTTGHFRGEVNVVGEGFVATTGLADDVMIICNSPEGNLEWVKTLGAALPEEPVDIAVDSESSIYLLVKFYDYIIVDEQPFFSPVPKGAPYYCLIKLDSSGALNWLKLLATGASTLAVDSEDNIVVSGTFTYTQNIAGTIYEPVDDDEDIYVVKYNSSGDVLWSGAYGGQGLDRPNDICFGANDEIYIAGKSFTSWTFGESQINLDWIGNGILLKFDANGDELWAVHANSGGTSEFMKLAYHPEFGLFVHGNYFEDLQFGNFDLDEPGTGNHPFTCRLSENGEYQWLMAHDNATHTGDLALDHLGNTFLISHFSDTLNLHGTELATGIHPDIYLYSYDAFGNLRFAEKTGGDLPERTVFIKESNDGGLYIGGIYRGLPYFFDQAGFYTDHSTNWNAFICKLNTSTTGVTDESLAINAYPNPTQNILWVEGMPALSNWKLYSSTGKLCLQGRCYTQSLKIDLSVLPRGVYFLKNSSPNSRGIKVIRN